MQAHATCGGRMNNSERAFGCYTKCSTVSVPACMVLIYNSFCFFPPSVRRLEQHRLLNASLCRRNCYLVVMSHAGSCLISLTKFISKCFVQIWCLFVKLLFFPWELPFLLFYWLFDEYVHWVLTNFASAFCFWEASWLMPWFPQCQRRPFVASWHPSVYASKNLT